MEDFTLCYTKRICLRKLLLPLHVSMKYLNKSHKFQNITHLVAATYRISCVLVTLTLFITIPWTFFFLGTCRTGVCALKTWGDLHFPFSASFWKDMANGKCTIFVLRAAEIVTFINMTSTKPNLETINISCDIMSI